MYNNIDLNKIKEKQMMLLNGFYKIHIKTYRETDKGEEFQKKILIDRKMVNKQVQYIPSENTIILFGICNISWFFEIQVSFRVAKNFLLTELKKSKIKPCKVHAILKETSPKRK